jgi:hypothetical protein
LKKYGNFGKYEKRVKEEREEKGEQGIAGQLALLDRSGEKTKNRKK